MNRSPSTFLKGAELASGFGAIVLGAGLGLLAPDSLRSMSWPVLIAGIGVHGAGMGLKYRLEHRASPPMWWERALYWGCWASLAALMAWMGWKWDR